MVLKHFKQILSARWTDFTAKAFSLWKGGCCTAWLSDVNIGGLQLAFATALEEKVDREILEILKRRSAFLYDPKYFSLAGPSPNPAPTYCSRDLLYQHKSAVPNATVGNSGVGF